MYKGKLLAMDFTRKFKISLIAALTAFGVSIFSWSVYDSSLFTGNTIVVPQDGSDKILSVAVRQVTERAGIKELRRKKLSKGDIEIRVWRGFGLDPLEGMIFRKTDGFWRAFYLQSGNILSDASNIQEPAKFGVTVRQFYGKPISGWDSFIDKIYGHGILTLPDATKTSCNLSDFLDGTAYLIELLEHDAYRYYAYHTGNENQCREGKQVMKIAKLIAQEFHNGVDKCQTAEWLPCLSRDID